MYDIRLAQDALIRSFFLQRHHQPVFADGEADPGSGWTAQSFGESVIASAAENCILRAQCAVRELKGRARVVVESAHQAVVQREGDAHLASGWLAPPRSAVRQSSSRNWLMRGSFSMIG